MAGARAEEDLDALIDRERRAVLSFIDERLLPLMIRLALAKEGASAPPAPNEPAAQGRPVAPPPGHPAPATDPEDAWLLDEPAPSTLPRPDFIAAWLRVQGAWRTGRIVMSYVEAARGGVPRKEIEAGLRAWGYSRRSVDAALSRLMESGAVFHDGETDTWGATRAYRSGMSTKPIRIGFDERGGSCPWPFEETGEA